MGKRHCPQARLFNIAATLAILFFVFVTAAMLIYTGGTMFDPHRPHYAVFINVFSDLGRTRTFTGDPNSASMILFKAAVLSAAGAMIFFFTAFSSCLRDRRRSLYLGRAGAMLGIAAAICFIGVGCTPWDRFKQAHIQFVYSAFGFFAGAILLDILAIFSAPSIPRRTLIVFSLFSILLLGYGGFLYSIIDVVTPSGSLQAIGQKLIVFCSLLTILVQSMAMRRHLTSRQTPT